MDQKMTWRKQTIMEMARKAGVTYSQVDGSYTKLEAFAALVRADLYKEMHDPMVLACKKMVAEERERIAKWYASEGHMMFPVAIPDAIRSNKLAQPDYLAVKTYHEGEPVYVAQQEPPKYRRGSRVICLETEEYCVIHISGTDRQWIKFPDSHIGVYTNEQVAELFELLPKEQPQQEQNLNCKSVQARLATAWGYVKAQSQQEPVAWWDGKESVVFAHDQIYTPNWTDYWTKPLYTVASPCPTCEALAHTVMLDQTSYDAAPPQRTWVGLTDEEANELWESTDSDWELIKRTEAKLKEKNERRRY